METVNANGTAIVKAEASAAMSLPSIERALLQGDLSKLTDRERMDYYKATCQSVGLNPLTKPFLYVNLNGRLLMYATRDCTDQLRKIHGISIEIVSHKTDDGICEVIAKASTPTGRTDQDMGAIDVRKLTGQDLANARMKTITKAKRRVTLSICGLGFLDETEVDDIRDAVKIDAVVLDKEAQDDLEQRVTGYLKRIGEAATIEALKAVASDVDADPAGSTIKDRIKDSYGARKKALTTRTPGEEG